MIAKTKKIIPYLFLLIALVGIFGYGQNTEAQTLGVKQCYTNSGVAILLSVVGSESNCLSEPGRTWRDNSIPQEVVSKVIVCKQQEQLVSSCLLTIMPMCSTIIPCKNMIVAEIKIATDAEVEKSKEKLGTSTGVNNNTLAFQQNIDIGCYDWSTWTFTGCILKFAYYSFFQIPTFLLFVSAYIFNALIALVIQSSMYTHGFIGEAWAVVRDLSNIFFILILLYIAIKTVLSMGGHETKSMITSVIIMAILINFSLFFTKIVIDSSNILALVFYNKLTTKYETKTGGEGERPFNSLTPYSEKDAAGALYAKFDATQLVNQKFIDKMKLTVNVPGLKAEDVKLPFFMTLGIMIIAGGIMLFAAYAFFTSGIFFLGRLLELWILMIAAPFAFMSFAIPKLAHTEYGWDKWTEKLLSTSFMAPIFMFFLYLIFKILGTKNFFDGFVGNDPGFMADILKILLPALIILGMLLKAKDLAKKGGGQFGEMVMNGVKMAGGLALGAATGGAGMLATGTIGRRAMNTLNDDTLRAKAASGGPGSKEAQAKLNKAEKWANKSFDLRDTGFGKFVANQSGMDFNRGTSTIGLDKHALEGGRAGQVKHEVEHMGKELKKFDMTAAAAVEQDAIAAKYKKDLKENLKADPNLDRERYKDLYEAINKVDVRTSSEINKERKNQYLDQKEKEHPHNMKEEVVSLFNTWTKEVGGMAKSPITKVAVPVTLVAGGLAGAAGVTTAAAVGVAGSFLKTLKSGLQVHGNDSHVIAELRRPKSTEQKLKEALKEAGGGEEKKPDAGHDDHPPAAQSGSSNHDDHPPATGGPAH